MADITLNKPAQGQQQVARSTPASRIVLNFPVDQTTMEKEGDNLVFKFDDNSFVVLEDFYQQYKAEAIPEFEVDGQLVAGAEFFNAFGPALSPAAGAGNSPAGGHRQEYTDLALADGINSYDDMAPADGISHPRELNRSMTAERGEREYSWGAREYSDKTPEGTTRPDLVTGDADNPGTGNNSGAVNAADTGNGTGTANNSNADNNSGTTGNQQQLVITGKTEIGYSVDFKISYSLKASDGNATHTCNRIYVLVDKSTDTGYTLSTAKPAAMQDYYGTIQMHSWGEYDFNLNADSPAVNSLGGDEIKVLSFTPVVTVNRGFGPTEIFEDAIKITVHANDGKFTVTDGDAAESPLPVQTGALAIALTATETSGTNSEGVLDAPHQGDDHHLLLGYEADNGIFNTGGNHILYGGNGNDIFVLADESDAHAAAYGGAGIDLMLIDSGNEGTVDTLLSQGDNGVEAILTGIDAKNANNLISLGIEVKNSEINPNAGKGWCEGVLNEGDGTTTFHNDSGAALTIAGGVSVNVGMTSEEQAGQQLANNQ